MEIMATGEALIGNNNKHSMVKTMKGIFKTFALLCIGLATVACVEENLDPNNGGYDTTPGNEIQFSAAAAVNNGNIQTKTEYGDNNGQYIEINWTAGDKITIASPEADGTTIAHYDIDTTDESFVEDADGYDDETNGGHKAVVKKRGGVGLQWSESDTYTFYGMYPMLDKDEDEDFNGTSELIEGTNGAPAVLKGFLPVSQNPKYIRTVGNSYIIDPDMRYAYMVAYDEFDRTATDSEGNNTDAVSLPFKSLSTVLQFQLKAASFTNQNIDQIKINSISIYSEKGNPICGPFKYTYPTSLEEKGTSIFDTESSGGISTSSFSRITMDFAQMGAEIILGADDSFDVTFFLLPIVDFSKEVEDLKLQIFYEVGDNGNVNFMTAKLGVDIQASRKYYFKNVTMKSIDTSVEGSQWISALVENIYISQLSIPVAGNAFASYYDDGDAANDSEKYYREQVLDYKTLWNMGVRGFEFCNSVTKSTSTSATLDTEPFVCNGQALNVQDENGQSITFGNALRYLESMLDMYPNEALFIIATYKSFSGDLGYYPDVYLRQLDNFINANDDIKDRLVKLNPNSTVKDLKGKIAILIRLKDDDYDARGSQITTALTNMSNLSKMTYIKNWGTAVDCWDRRFGSGYMRQMAYGGSGTQVEYYLGAVSSSETSFNTQYKSFQDGYPASQEATNANYNLRSYGATADDIYLQEWARVVPKEFADQSMSTPLSTGVRGFYDGIFSDSYLGYLWTRWYDSSKEKVNMVNAALSSTLATKGATNSGKLYFNSLAGYYVTTELLESYLPYTGGNFTITQNYRTYKFDTVRPGAGGDYAGLAADLNTHFYDEFKKIEGTDKQGPLGFVILDYIGASANDFMKSKYLVDNTSKTHASIDDAVEASSKLPNMILMNNFKFPLSQLQSTTPQQTSYDAKYVDGGEAISFE